MGVNTLFLFMGLSMVFSFYDMWLALSVYHLLSLPEFNYTIYKVCNIREKHAPTALLKRITDNLK